MNQNDVFVVRNHPMSLRLVLGLMDDADSAEETKSWALSALFHAGYTHDDSLRDYLRDRLEAKGLHVYNEQKVEAREQRQRPLSDEEKSLERRLFEGRLRSALNHIMNLKGSDGKPLFCKKNHWWAVFRIFVDLEVGNIRENRYKEFIELIEKLQLEHVNAELDMTSLSNITQDVYCHPFTKWELYIPENASSRWLTGFQRMSLLAEKLKISMRLKGF